MEYYSTAVVAGAQRLAYWSDLVSETFTGLSVTPEGERPFEATLARAQVGGLILSSPVSSAARLLHTKRHIASLNERCVLVHYQMKGSCDFMQQGRAAVLNEGDFALADTACPYSFRLSDDHCMIVVRVPLRLLGAWPFEVDQMCGVKVSGAQPAAKLLSGYMTTLWNEVLQGPNTDLLPGALVAKTMIDLIELVCTPYGHGIRRTLRREATRDAVVRFIDERIYDPKLSIGVIAASLKVTPRYIQKLFAEIETTVGQYICSARIRAAAQRLEDPNEAHRSITEIAFTVGFNDLSHFGRVFKGAFGVTPAEHRRRMLGARDIVPEFHSL